ncbi:MAG: sugar phosphate isomerase/epimerase [Alphaproteobacteria bacterium]|nr:sugar phosphate isomerase/epimerase [Alphaproteobacteria bacterium]
MRLGIFAKTFAGLQPGDVLQAAASAGYSAVQYNWACSGLGALPQAIPDEAGDAVQQAAQSHGVSVSAISATYNMLTPDMGQREAGRRAFTAIATQAHRMGTSLITLCTGSRDAADQWRHHPENASADTWADMLREFEFLLPLAEAHDVTLGVEPELGNAVSSAAKARKLLDTFKSPRIKIVFDAANLFEQADARQRQAIIDEAAGLLAGDIIMAHAKDRKADGSFAAAGHGVIDFAAYFTTLRRAGFAGHVITHGLDAAEAPAVAQFLTPQMQAAGLPVETPRTRT